MGDPIFCSVGGFEDNIISLAGYQTFARTFRGTTPKAQTLRIDAATPSSSGRSCWKSFAVSTRARQLPLGAQLAVASSRFCVQSIYGSERSLPGRSTTPVDFRAEGSLWHKHARGPQIHWCRTFGARIQAVCHVSWVATKCVVRIGGCAVWCLLDSFTNIFTGSFGGSAQPSLTFFLSIFCQRAVPKLERVSFCFWCYAAQLPSLLELAFLLCKLYFCIRSRL